MSPSNRAGGTVDGTVTDDAPATDASAPSSPDSRPRRNGDRDGEAAMSASRPKRTAVSDGSAGPPARGSATERGTSSTTIARQSGEGNGNGERASGSAPGSAVEPASASRSAVAPSAPAHPAPGHQAVPAVSPPVGPPAPARPPGRRLDQIDTGLVAPTGPPGPPPPGPSRTSISDHLVAPVPRVLGRRPRVRKVTRVVRHVDPWSVFKVALVFNVVLYGVLLTAGVLLWNVAHATGTVDNVERFFESFGWDEFEFDGGAIFHNAWIAGLFAVVGLTGAAVLAATLFNLITDLVGGVRMTVLEEEVVEKTAAPIRRFVVQRPGGLSDHTGGLRRPGPPTTDVARRDGG